MNTKTRTLCLLAAALLALKGDSCILENKDVEVPFRGDADMDFTSQGTNDTSSETIDFAQELMDVEADADNEIDELVSVAIENGFWRLVENRGDPGTTVTGSITVTRLSNGASASIVNPTLVAIESVGSEFVPAPLNAAGVQLLVDGMNEYLDARNSGLPLPDLRYRFDWVSASSVSADFDWQARIRFTIVGVFKVEVPDLWGG